MSADKDFRRKIIMKVKIIKHIERQTVTTAHSGASREPKDAGTVNTIAATVKFWIEESRQKSESDATLFKKLFKAENRSAKS